MKSGIFGPCMILAALACLGGRVLAHDFDLVDNKIGDSRLATFCGYSLARPVSIELLSVTNGSGSVVSHSVGARIVYRDLRASHPSRIEWGVQQATGELLNEWLAAYVRGECARMDLDALCESYLGHEFAHRLQVGFPEYVRERIEELPDPSLLNVEAVTIDMLQAEGAFRAELIRRSSGVDETQR